MYSLAFGIVLTAVLAGISLTIGAADMSFATLLAGEDRAAQVLMISRIPRTLAIMLAGSSLGIAGLVMQMIVRNRFVEPSTTGTTESAMLGFLIVTLLAPGWPVMAKMGVAAGFAFLGTLLFLRLLRFVPLREVVLVPLVGIMLAGVIGAVTSFIAYRYGLLPSVLAWSMGDFSGVLRGRYELLWLGLACTLVAALAADRFTVAGMGREFTTNLGLNYQRLMVLGRGIVSVIAAVCLVSVGSIPFLGLVVPNVVSLMIGDNMRRAVPWVAVGGAAFVLAGDIIGRLVRYPYEVPISVVVGVIGSGVFIVLLLRRRSHA
ncbi:ABC transporter permease [Paenirhodobacter sp.]|uniref:ABC transporter permease n=1 Tax=Paenirhodobacter sp. TaxID=1965326 RepID=UPI003B41280C